MEPATICKEGNPPSGSCPGTLDPLGQEGRVAERAAQPEELIKGLGPDFDFTLSDSEDGDAPRQPLAESGLDEILASCVVKAAAGGSSGGCGGGGSRGDGGGSRGGGPKKPASLVINIGDVVPGGGPFGGDGQLPVGERALEALLAEDSEFQHDEVVAAALGDALACRMREHPGLVPPVFPWCTFDWAQAKTGEWWRDKRFPGLLLPFDPFDCESWWFPCNYVRYHWFSILVRLPTAAQKAEILIFDSSPGISQARKAEDRIRELLVQMGTGRAGWEPDVVRTWPVGWPASTPLQRFVDCGVYAAVWGRHAVLYGVLPHAADPPQVWDTPNARRDKQLWLYNQLLQASRRGTQA